MGIDWKKRKPTPEEIEAMNAAVKKAGLTDDMFVNLGNGIVSGIVDGVSSSPWIDRTYLGRARYVPMVYEGTFGLMGIDSEIENTVSLGIKKIAALSGVPAGLFGGHSNYESTRQFQEYIRSRLYGSMFGVDSEDATTYGEETDISLDDVAEVMAKLRAHGPVAQGIWFVDRLREYYQLLDMVPKVEMDPKQGIAQTLMGLRVAVFQSADMDKGDVIAERGEPASARLAAEIEAAEGNFPGIVWPWFCNYPGIWVEMSDGNHRQLMDGDGRWVERQAEYIKPEIEHLVIFSPVALAELDKRFGYGLEEEE